MLPKGNTPIAAKAAKAMLVYCRTLSLTRQF